MTNIIHDGKPISRAHSVVMETWLREAVLPAFDAIKADPMLGVGIDRIRARLAAEHRAAKKSKKQE